MRGTGRPSLYPMVSESTPRLSQTLEPELADDTGRYLDGVEAVLE